MSWEPGAEPDWEPGAEPGDPNVNDPAARRWGGSYDTGALHDVYATYYTSFMVYKKYYYCTFLVRRWCPVVHDVPSSCANMRISLLHAHPTHSAVSGCLWSSSKHIIFPHCLNRFLYGRSVT